VPGPDESNGLHGNQYSAPAESGAADPGQE
jgi:hypothetical protein